MEFILFNIRPLLFQRKVVAICLKTSDAKIMNQSFLGPQGLDGHLRNNARMQDGNKALQTMRLVLNF